MVTTPTWAQSSADPVMDNVGSMNEEAKLTNVLEVLMVTDRQNSLKLVKTDKQLTKHLLHLYDVIELYRKEGHFKKQEDAKDSHRLRQSQHAIDLFYMFNTATDSATKNAGLHFKRKNTNKRHYALSLIFLGLQMTAFVLSTIAAAHVDVGLPAEGMSSANPVSWGYVNAVGGIVQGMIEVKMGNTAMGAGLLLSNAQLLVTTIAIHAGQAAGVLSAMGAGSIMGFSFTICMFSAYVMERHQARLANNRMKLLKKELDKITDRDQHAEKVDHLEHGIMVEKAKRDNHLRHAASWKYCTAAMLSVSVIVLLALGSVSLGALPSIAAGIAVIAILSTMIRRYWVNKVDHLEQAKLSRDENLILKLTKLEAEIVFDDNTTIQLDDTIRVGTCFFRHNTTIRDYLKEMLHRDHHKARGLLLAIEQKAEHTFFEHLGTKGLWAEGASIGAHLIKKYRPIQPIVESDARSHDEWKPSVTPGIDENPFASFS